MTKEEYSEASTAISAAISRVIARGSDDVFKPPVFSQSIEGSVIAANEKQFREDAYRDTMRFIKNANLSIDRIGSVSRSLVSKDQSSFRQVAWLDPFDAVKYLSLAILVFPGIERNRPGVDLGRVHSHRINPDLSEVFRDDFGYDSFRKASSEMSSKRIGEWKVITDIANFFDRVGNHTLENHLLNCGCNKKYVTLIREVLLFWAGDRRSFGIPVGSDASRILSEAVLLDVDRRLAERGIEFVRYVDDFRIFARNRASALKNVEILTSLLADEGLSLNSRKTSISKIVNADEISQFANRFAAGEHETIDLDKKVEFRRAIRVSGQTAIARFYREPGKDTVRKIKRIPKESIFNKINEVEGADFEENVKLAVKFFIYADRDVSIIERLLESKLTSIFYICDALVKESDAFDDSECLKIKDAVIGAAEWLECAYPLQIPIVRLVSHEKFFDSSIVQSIINNQRRSDNMVFYREVLSLGYACLDRATIRRIAIDEFEATPEFVKRAIFRAVSLTPILSDDERRPLLKNMQQSTSDWFIKHM